MNKTRQMDRSRTPMIALNDINNDDQRSEPKRVRGKINDRLPADKREREQSAPN